MCLAGDAPASLKTAQCMECITACPDTALPNTAQDISTVLVTAIRNYVSDWEAASALNEVAGWTRCCAMNESGVQNQGTV